jgi:hypothetical protein
MDKTILEKLLTPEFIAMIGVPAFLLIVILVFLGMVLFFQGRKIDDMGKKIDRMCTENLTASKNLEIKIAENTKAVESMKDGLDNLVQMEFAKLQRNYPDIAEKMKAK